MQGVIVQVSISLGGLPKRAISGGLITPLGIEGDLHAHPAIHGGPRKAILWLPEVIDDLIARGYPLFPARWARTSPRAASTIRDIRIGDRLRAGGATARDHRAARPLLGAGYLRRIAQGRNLRRTRAALDHTSPRWGMSGFYASVVAPGPCVRTI
jgi:hypothetical protein